MRRSPAYLLPGLLGLIGLMLAIKLPAYFNSTPLTGWDTGGHAHLTRAYIDLFSHGESTGYDPAWFGGFPLFYFYPPAFYFFAAQLQLIPGISSQLAYHLTVFAGLLVFAYFYLRWFALFWPRRASSDDLWLRTPLMLLLLCSYLAFAGDGLQGVGLIGVLNGTVVTIWGHAFTLATLCAVERMRQNRGEPWRAIAWLSLLFYTHTLSSAFCYLLLAVYLFAARNEGREFLRSMALVFIVPLLVAAPILFNYFGYSAFINGRAIAQHYPALLSILGVDFFMRIQSAPPGYYLDVLLSEIFWHGVWLVLLLLAGAGYLLTRVLAVPGSSRQRPLLVFAVLFPLLLLWFTQDTSLSFVLHPIGIHWYRLFDLFFGGLVLAGVLGIAHALRALRRRHRLAALALAWFLGLAALLRLVLWDPVQHEDYESLQLYGYNSDPAQLETFLNTLPPGSLILPEKIRDKNYFGSPHAFDHFIQQAGHRNALGLTIESAETPSLFYAYLAQSLPQLFLWGIDAKWNKSLYEGLPGIRSDSLAAYLRRAGVGYILTRTPNAAAYLDARPGQFTRVFATRENIRAYQVQRSDPRAALASPRPIGYLSLGRLRGGPARGREFLLDTNRLRLRDYLAAAPPIINLDPLYQPEALDPLVRLRDLVPSLGALMIYHTDGGLMPAEAGERFARFYTGPLLLLVNFQKTAGTPETRTTRYLYSKVFVPQLLAPYSTPVDDPPRTEPIQTVEFSGRQVRLQFGATPARLAPNACTAIVLRLSYFPDWQRLPTNGTATPACASLPPLRSDTNQMLVFADPEHDPGVALKFRGSFARTISVMLYLLLLAVLLPAGLARRLRDQLRWLWHRSGLLRGRRG